MENKKEVLNDLHRKKAAICFGCGVRVYMREKRKKRKKELVLHFPMIAFIRKTRRRAEKKGRGVIVVRWRKKKKTHTQKATHFAFS